MYERCTRMNDSEGSAVSMFLSRNSVVMVVPSARCMRTYSPSLSRSAKPKLPPEEALFQALSLCRKAGALTMGFDAVEDACVKSKAWLVMVASDASAKTVQRLDYSVGDLVDVITMPLTQDKLADISRKPVAVYAVTDRNLAKLCFDRLSDCGAIKNEEDMTE